MKDSILRVLLPETPIPQGRVATRFYMTPLGFTIIVEKSPFHSRAEFINEISVGCTSGRTLRIPTGARATRARGRCASIVCIRLCGISVAIGSFQLQVKCTARRFLQCFQVPHVPSPVRSMLGQV